MGDFDGGDPRKYNGGVKWRGRGERRGGRDGRGGGRSGGQVIHIRS